MRKQNLWCLMSVHFGALRPRSVHPASPVLLTKNGPLIVLDPNARVQLSNRGLAPIRSSRVREGRYAPQTPNRCSTGCDSPHDCYPEGNFDRNQLPAMPRPGRPRRLRLSIAAPASRGGPPAFSLWTNAPGRIINRGHSLRVGPQRDTSPSSLLALQTPQGGCYFVFSEPPGFDGSIS